MQLTLLLKQPLLSGAGSLLGRRNPIRQFLLERDLLLEKTQSAGIGLGIAIVIPDLIFDTGDRLLEMCDVIPVHTASPAHMRVHRICNSGIQGILRDENGFLEGFPVNGKSSSPI